MSGDPLAMRRAEKAKLRAEEATVKTFREVAEALIELKRPGWTSAKHTAQWERTLETAHEAFGAVAVQLVDTHHVVNVLKPIWTATPETGARLRSRIAAVLDHTKALKLRIGDNPADWKGGLQASLPANQAKAKLAHYTVLPYTAAAAFRVDLRSQRGTAARALEFAILTAARTREVIGAMWLEIDDAERVWNVVPEERMKAGKPHRVPLNPRAIALLEALPRASDFIFANIRGKTARTRSTTWPCSPS